MRIIKLNDENFLSAIDEAKTVLSDGGVVLVPTETVYGLVCQYQNDEAREKIYQLKKLFFFNKKKFCEN